MHRATPSATSHRSYSSGGARSFVSGADDSQHMQQFNGTFMNNESRENMEAPQNYGFTSVVMDATKDALGNITGAAETFMSFIGGNRSFGVAGNMDDRRHRLFGLEKGDSAMYRTKDDKQQFHLSQDGMFGTAPRDKELRFGLLDEDSGQQQQGQQGGQGGGGGGGSSVAAASAPGIATFDAGGGGGGSPGSGGASSGNGAGGQQQHGQKARYKDMKKSFRFMSCKKDETSLGGQNVRQYGKDGTGYSEINEDKNVYEGALKGKAKFALIVTLKGPTKNVMGKIG